MHARHMSIKQDAEIDDLSIDGGMHKKRRLNNTIMF